MTSIRKKLWAIGVGKKRVEELLGYSSWLTSSLFFSLSVSFYFFSSFLFGRSNFRALWSLFPFLLLFFFWAPPPSPLLRHSLARTYSSSVLSTFAPIYRKFAVWRRGVWMYSVLWHTDSGRKRFHFASPRKRVVNVITALDCAKTTQGN